MTDSLAVKKQTQELSIWEDKTQLTEIKKLFAPKLTQLEFEFFVGLGKANGLNPFNREIWCVKYKDSEPPQVFIGRDGYRKIAQSHPKYDYHQSHAVYSKDIFEVVDGEVRHRYSFHNRGELIGAYCVTKRKGAERPIFVSLPLSEYSTGRSTWGSKPETMIKKCAEAQCLRAAFQDVLAGTYAEEEYWGQEEKEKQTIHVIQGETNTEKLKNIIGVTERTIEPVEEKHQESLIVESEDSLMISKQQSNEILKLIVDKGFSEARFEKALKYYMVEKLEELTEQQAISFIENLRKAV